MAMAAVLAPPATAESHSRVTTPQPRHTAASRRKGSRRRLLTQRGGDEQLVESE